MMDRRELLKGAIGGAAGIALGSSFMRASAQGQTGEPLKLSDDLFVLRIPGECNVIAQTSADGVLLVDGGSAKGSDAVMNALSGLPGKGHVHTLFNTHWHPEQTGSNERLGKAGTAIIAQ